MFGRMCDVPIRRKLVAGMTACCFTLIDDLDRQNVTDKLATKDSCDETLVIDSNHLHSLGTLPVHGPSGGQYDLNPRLIPVQNQLCWDLSSICTVATTSSRNASFSRVKSTIECLLLAVVTFFAQTSCDSRASTSSAC